MRLYLDSSALVKRSVFETESDPLEEYLAAARDSGAILISSALSWIEVGRVHRSRMDTEHTAPFTLNDLLESAFDGIAEAPVTAQVTALARRIGPPTLRSLDAIHLATATLIDADVVIAYDRRMLTIAKELGFRTESPH